MFAVNMRDAPLVLDYDSAERVLEKAMTKKPRTVQENGDNCYPIPGKENSPQMSVRETKDGIAFRYHYTDVITWHPDGSYTLCTYQSRSTCAFFGHFCPGGQYLTRDGAVLIIDDLGYALGTTPVHVKDGIPRSGLAHFYRDVVDRKNAKRVLAETRYAEYREWYAIMKPLLGNQTQPHFHVIDTLEDEANWPMMASCRFNDGHPDTVRKAIYYNNYHECYKTETYDVLPANKAHNSAYRVG